MFNIILLDFTNLELRTSLLNMKHRRILNIIFKAFVIFLAIFIIVSLIYIKTPSKPTQEAVDFHNQTSESISINPFQKLLIYRNKASNADSLNSLFLIYPGGKVQPESYSLLCKEVLTWNDACAVVTMPGNLAVIPHAGLDSVLSKIPNYEGVTVAGHSLGGPFLIRDLQKIDTEKYNINRLVLLGSYSDIDATKIKPKTFSLVGNQDKLLGEKAEKFKNNLPADTIFVIIDGGNHAQWGDYGVQKKDGNASLSSQAQKTQISKVLNP
jgi:hypothetical protein